MRFSLPKVHSFAGVARLANSLRRKGKKIVFTNGCFDILHAGHVDYLEKAKRAGNFLIVGLNSDASVRRLKGSNRPLNTQRDRARVLNGLAAVDGIVIFHDDTPLRLIQKVKPHILVKGSDWKVRQIAGAREVLSWGGRLVRIPLSKGRSTSALIRKISLSS